MLTTLPSTHPATHAVILILHITLSRTHYCSSSHQFVTYTPSFFLPSVRHVRTIVPPPISSSRTLFYIFYSHQFITYTIVLPPISHIHYFSYSHQFVTYTIVLPSSISRRTPFVSEVRDVHPVILPLISS